LAIRINDRDLVFEYKKKGVPDRISEFRLQKNIEMEHEVYSKGRNSITLARKNDIC
jgi:hypothetical protein